MWCVPNLTPEFITRMEGLLELYTLPPNPSEPLICMDEKSKQLLHETREPLPMKEGSVLRRDYEYKRNGTRNIFLAVLPHEGKRFSSVTKRRTKKDFAIFIKYLMETHCANAMKIHLVLDNLNTHFAGSFIEAFGREEADRLLRRIQFHYTPKHASWLNMAEIELSILSNQCIKGRIQNEAVLVRQMRAWEKARNAARATITWSFTVADARKKFHYETQLS